MRYGYDRRLAAGVIAASGTLAQVIPPGIVLIVLADQLNVSVIDIFAAALRPALMLAGLYVLYVFAISILKPEAAPAVPSKLRGAPLALRVILVMLPPLALILLVLGSIFLGVATPSEGGAMGAAGALVLAFVKGRLSLDLLRQATHRTARLASFAIFILIGSRIFSLTFFGVNGHKWVESLLVAFPGGATGFLLFINGLIFILAFFLEFFEIAFILVPLVASAAVKLGIDLVWLAVLIGVNVQTSFMHPPFGYSLFYLRSVAPDEPYRDRENRQADHPFEHKGHLLGRRPLRPPAGGDGRRDHRAAGDRLRAATGAQPRPRPKPARTHRRARQGVRPGRLAGAAVRASNRHDGLTASWNASWRSRSTPWRRRARPVLPRDTSAKSSPCPCG